MRKNRRRQTRWSVESETVELIRACARLMSDRAIAGLLNGDRKADRWIEPELRNTHMSVDRPAEAVAAALNVRPMKARAGYRRFASDRVRQALKAPLITKFGARDP